MPFAGRMSSDGEAMRLERSFRQAADTLAFQALQRADNKEICHHQASAFGASMLRSYAEEQRLIQENALVCSQLDALRRQCADEADWRSNSRELHAQLAQKSKELASQQQKHSDDVSRLVKEIADISVDLRSAQGAEARLTEEVKGLEQELEVCRVRLKSQEELCVAAHLRANQKQLQLEADAAGAAVGVAQRQALETQLSVLRAQVDAGNMARYAKDAQIASLVADSHAAITQCKALAASMAELTQRGERVRELEAQHAQRERLLFEAVSAREALSKEVGGLHEELRASHLRIHALQDQALASRQALHQALAHTSQVESKYGDSMSRMQAAEASAERVTKRVELLESNAAKLLAQLAEEEHARARLELQLAEAHKEVGKVGGRLSSAMEAARRATQSLEAATRDKAEAARVWEEREASLADTLLSMQHQLHLRTHAARASEVLLEELRARSTAAEHERDTAKAAAALLEEQVAARVKTVSDLSERLSLSSMTAAAAEKGAAATTQGALHLHFRASRAEHGERVQAERVEHLDRALQSSEHKCTVLLRELALTEGVRKAAEDESSARAAAEQLAAVLRREMEKMKRQLDAAVADVDELQARRRDQLAASVHTEQSLRQVKSELQAQQSECQALTAKLLAATTKTDAVRAKEQPLLLRVQQAEQLRDDARATALALHKALAAAKREAGAAKGRQRQWEKEASAHRHSTVNLERQLLVGETTRLELQEHLRSLKQHLIESEKTRAQQEKQIARLEMLLNKGQLEMDHARLEARLAARLAARDEARDEARVPPGGEEEARGATRPHSSCITLDSVVSEPDVSEPDVSSPVTEEHPP